MKGDGDLRMLGAVDGMAHALIQLRNVISSVDDKYRPIDKRHTRKLAAQNARLKPLRELETWLQERLIATRAAYERTRQL